MFENHYATGYTFYEAFPNQFVIECEDGPKYYGSFKEVVSLMCTSLWFSLDEIEFAVEEMLTSSHNAAHFGINRLFIYSYNKTISDLSEAS